MPEEINQSVREQTSEERKVEIRDRLSEGNRIEKFSDEWYDHIAHTQQELGVDSIPELIRMTKEREIHPYYASQILEGLNAPSEELYAAAKELAACAPILHNVDGSSFGVVTDIMMAYRNSNTLNDYNQLLELAENIESEERKIMNINKLNSHKQNLNRVDDNDIYRLYLNREREIWKQIYQLGYREYVRRMNTHVTLSDEYYSDPYDDDPGGLEVEGSRSDNQGWTALDSYKLMLEDMTANNKDKDRIIQIRMARRDFEKRETSESPYLPTIGLEIEVPRHGMTDKTYTVPTEVYKIPDDHDTIDSAEFALNPSRNYEVQLRQIYELYRLGYLKPDHVKYPLHINIGGIEFMGEENNDEYLLMWGLLSTGWASSEKRINMTGPYGRGTGGLAHRGTNDQYKRVEMRPFTLRGMNNITRTLHTAQLSGAALIAYRIPEDKRDNIQAHLAEVWKEYKHGMELILTKHSLSKTKLVHELNSLAIEIGKSERGEADPDNDIRKQSRELLITTRKKVADILAVTR